MFTVFMIIFISILIGMSLAILIIVLLEGDKRECVAGVIFTLLSSAGLAVGLIVNNPHVCY